MGQIPGHLGHETRARAGGDPRDPNAASRKLHDKQNVVRDRSGRSCDLDGEEAGGRQRFPVRSQEHPPRRSLASLEGWLDSVCLQDVRDRPARDLMVEMRKSSLDSGVAPREILSCHPNDEARDFLFRSRTTRLPACGVVPPACHELPVPGQSRLWRDDRRDLFEDSPTERLPLHAESAPLVISQSETLAAELAFEDPVLFDQVVDDISLLPIDPTCDADDQQLPRVNGVHPGDGNRRVLQRVTTGTLAGYDAFENLDTTG